MLEIRMVRVEIMDPQKERFLATSQSPQLSHCLFRYNRCLFVGTLSTNFAERAETPTNVPGLLLLLHPEDVTTNDSDCIITGFLQALCECRFRRCNLRWESVRVL